MLKGFKEFIFRGNVVDLAVGVVIGGAFGSVVNALVKDLITPLIGAIAKVPDMSNKTFTINGSHFLYGEFLNALISFVLVAAAIYFCIVLPMNAALKRFQKPTPPPAPPAPTKEQELLMEIRDLLKK